MISDTMGNGEQPFGNLLCMCVTDYVVGVCHIAGCRNSGERASRAGTDTPTKRASERLIGSELPNEGRIQTKVRMADS